MHIRNESIFLGLNRDISIVCLKKEYSFISNILTLLIRRLNFGEILSTNTKLESSKQFFFVVLCPSKQHCILGNNQCNANIYVYIF